MRDPADQDDGQAGLVIATLLGLAPGFIVLIALMQRILVGDEAEAGGGGDREDGDAGIEEADKAAEGLAGDADEVAGAKQQPVADDAAHAGRQRPARGGGQGAGNRAGGGDADDPEPELERATIEQMEANQPQRPDHRRKQQRHDAEPEQLHQQIGEHGAGAAEPVADGAAGRIVQAGIVDRPGGERQRDRAHQSEQAEAGDLGRTPRQKLPRRIGQAVHQRGRTSDRAHALVPFGLVAMMARAGEKSQSALSFTLGSAG